MNAFIDLEAYFISEYASAYVNSSITSTLIPQP